MSLRGGIGLPELPLEDGQEFRLGIMGGTFDPIHYGHLVTAEQARESLDLDAVLFMPAGSPAFKLDKPVTPAEDRYAMTVLATAANPAFLASRFDRPSWRDLYGRYASCPSRLLSASGKALLYYGCRCDYRYCDLAQC